MAYNCVLNPAQRTRQQVRQQSSNQQPAVTQANGLAQPQTSSTSGAGGGGYTPRPPQTQTSQQTQQPQSGARPPSYLTWTPQQQFTFFSGGTTGTMGTAGAGGGGEEDGDETQIPGGQAPGNQFTPPIGPPQHGFPGGDMAPDPFSVIYEPGYGPEPGDPDFPGGGGPELPPVTGGVAGPPTGGVNTGTSGGTTGGSTGNTGPGNWDWVSGFDWDKWDSGHDSPKYQIGHTLAQFDPTLGLTPEVIDALNALGFGNFEMIDEDEFSIANPVDELGAGIYGGDLIEDFASGNGRWAWNPFFEGDATTSGSATGTGTGITGTGTTGAGTGAGAGAGSGATTASTDTYQNAMTDLAQLIAQQLYDTTDTVNPAMLKEKQKETLLDLMDQRRDWIDTDAAQRGVGGAWPGAAKDATFANFASDLTGAYRDIDMAAAQQEFENLLGAGQFAGGLGTQLAMIQLQDKLGQLGIELDWARLAENARQFGLSYALQSALAEYGLDQDTWSTIMQFLQ